MGLKKRPLEWEVKANVVQYRDNYAGMKVHPVLGSSLWLYIHVSIPDRVLDDLISMGEHRYLDRPGQPRLRPEPEIHVWRSFMRDWQWFTAGIKGNSQMLRSKRREAQVCAY